MTYDNITFDVPAGWKAVQTADAMTLTPPEMKPPEVLQVMLLPGRPSRADLRQEFEAAWSELQSSLGAEPMFTVDRTLFDLDEPGRSARGWDYLRGTGGMRIAGASWTLDLYVIRAGDRVERIAVFAADFRDNLTTANASLNPRYARAIQGLIFTLRFTNLPPFEVAPATIRGGGIAGVWAGLAMSFGRIKPYVAVFFDDGTAYFGPTFPLNGLDGIDPTVEQPRARRYWGSYKFRDGAGALTMPYDTIPLRASGPGLELTTSNTPHRYIRLHVPPIERLLGDWCFDDGRCLRLEAGGRFEDTGAVRVLEHQTYPFPDSPARGVGNYEIRDHTLTLRYDGGPELRIAFPGVIEAAAAPRELILGFNLDRLTRR